MPSGSRGASMVARDMIGLMASNVSMTRSRGCAFWYSASSSSHSARALAQRRAKTGRTKQRARGAGSVRFHYCASLYQPVGHMVQHHCRRTLVMRCEQTPRNLYWENAGMHDAAGTASGKSLSM